MAKYSFEFKKKVVQEYLNGEGGALYLSKRYNISQMYATQVQNWIKVYQAFGDDGLKRSRKNNSYSFEFKLHVVELYLRNEVSYQELSLSQGINNPALITRWVNDFRIAGPDALRPKQKGRPTTLKLSHKKDSKAINTANTMDISSKHVKELEDKVLKLEIENAYLKELRRLRLEEEKLLKKQRELSTASEDDTN